jgi:hypothetical protein
MGFGAALGRLTRPGTGRLDVRQEYRGGWPLGYMGADCPADAPVGCPGAGNLNCCPTGQFCDINFSSSSVYCCPTGGFHVPSCLPACDRSNKPPRIRLWECGGQHTRVRELFMGPLQDFFSPVWLLPGWLFWRVAHLWQHWLLRSQHR